MPAAVGQAERGLALSIPDAIREAVGQAAGDLGLGGHIRSATPVAGGCINHGVRVETDAGASLFLKWNAEAPPGMFAAEAAGLVALREPGALRVPEPLQWNDDPTEGPGWLLMEWIARGRQTPASDERLGRGLAVLHRHRVPSGPTDYGFEHDNWIGSLPQANAPMPSWGDFWRDRRIAPQLDVARRAGLLRDPAFDVVLDVAPTALAGHRSPDLLHGDLWSGNAFVSEDGDPILIDPAVYRGDGEVDLAMSELFGGFGPTFYDAYADTRGVSAEYGAYRRDLYQLYYLLVHVNLFGGSYADAARGAAQRVAATLR